MRKRRNTNLREEITVGKSKTKGGEGRVVPLSNTALRRLKEWRCQFPDATPAHYLFPSERYGLHGSKGAFGGW
jgi:integrase